MPVTSEINDLMGENMAGSLYEKELQIAGSRNF